MREPEIITAADLAALSVRAREARRRRTHRNLHAAFDEPVQRFLIAAEPDTYFPPHRHADKPWEMVVLVQGAVDVLMFSDDGVLQRRMPLRSDGDRMIQYPAGTFHSVVVAEPGTVVLEIKEGPYVAERDKQMPPWGADEGSPEASARLERLKVLQPGDRLG
ncbi:MAG: cupin fold metalloprotein, WbuC family [Rhodospirillales bacterium CG15_BIG_FIL_POST_REV_8_21_14_020_66_15]|nr:MAG: cupin fold metalloprotein, WbuC family [Rhodospirillales bacterium CG15_BIG_FIL_POST_REV_8_21_14_020_66_15]